MIDCVCLGNPKYSVTVYSLTHHSTALWLFVNLSLLGSEWYKWTMIFQQSIPIELCRQCILWFPGCLATHQNTPYFVYMSYPGVDLFVLQEQVKLSVRASQWEPCGAQAWHQLWGRQTTLNLRQMSADLWNERDKCLRSQIRLDSRLVANIVKLLWI